MLSSTQNLFSKTYTIKVRMIIYQTKDEKGECSFFPSYLKGNSSFSRIDDSKSRHYKPGSRMLLLCDDLYQHCTVEHVHSQSESLMSGVICRGKLFEDFQSLICPPISRVCDITFIMIIGPISVMLFPHTLAFDRFEIHSPPRFD